MVKKIFKFNVPLADSLTILMPAGAEIIHFAPQLQRAGMEILARQGCAVTRSTVEVPHDTEPTKEEP